ncbi:MAG: hypothetical protein R3B95_12175 [Nitrospirales bacterium]|nr:hypothetical protein [Nitrospirales bacterium]
MKDAFPQGLHEYQDGLRKACAVLVLAFIAVADPLLCSVLAAEQTTHPHLHAEGERYTRFSSLAAEYEFEYPADWQVRERLNEAEPEVGFIGPSIEPRIGRVVLRVCRSTKSPVSPSLGKVLQELVDLAKSGEAHFLEIRAAEIDGTPSRIVTLARVWRMPLNLCEMMNPREITERPVVERYVLVEREGRFYSVCYMAPEALDARFSAVFEHVVRTFHFRTP